MGKIIQTLAICCLWVYSSASAGTFVDDFEDGVANGWRRVSGDWRVADGNYTLAKLVADVDKPVISVLDSPWKVADGIITVTFSFDKAAKGSERPIIFFRLKDDLKGYAFEFHGKEKWMTMGKIEDGKFAAMRGDKTDGIVIRKPVTIRIELQGNVFLVFYNGVPRLRVGDIKSQFKTGRIGLGARNANTPIHFEEIKIEADGVTQFAPDLRPVQPQNRLADTWARLKQDRDDSE
ncbi:MAG: hypothetical protein QGH37_14200 [Candidatus Poribacteria bacterium]|nr:hypothetical protein [Candidatus Poribacteria bacterium]MDP6998540.1 hypothetical protein [Candidatus Poribacteria bacterium]